MDSHRGCEILQPSGPECESSLVGIKLEVVFGYLKRTRAFPVRRSGGTTAFERY